MRAASILFVAAVSPGDAVVIRTTAYRPALLSTPLQRPMTTGMTIASQLASGSGAVIAGVVAGAALGPTMAGASAASVGLKKKYEWSEIAFSAGITVFFSVTSLSLSALAFSLGSSAVGPAPAAIRLPLAFGLITIVAAMTPMAALVTGTIIAPAVPYREDQVEQTLEMRCEDSD